MARKGEIVNEMLVMEEEREESNTCVTPPLVVIAQVMGRSRRWVGEERQEHLALLSSRDGLVERRR